MASNVLCSATRGSSTESVELFSEGLYPVSKKPDAAVRNLALAILLQAFRDVVAPGRRRSSRQASAWRQDAIDWFFADSHRPGSFSWVRDILGIESNHLLDWVRTYQASSPPARVEMVEQLKHFQMPH